MFRENHWNIDMVVATMVLALALSRYPIHRLSSYQHLDTLQEEAILYCYGEGEGEVTTSADCLFTANLFPLCTGDRQRLVAGDRCRHGRAVTEHL